MATPSPRPGILDIAPYKPGLAPRAAFNLASNESALGASKKAIDAYGAAARSIHLYPDGSSSALRTRIGEVYGLDPQRIICGAGSDELLQLLCRAYAGAGDTIVQSEHGFLVYALAAKACGAGVRSAPERNLTADVDAMRALIESATRIVFIANPNNPTGTYVSDREIRRLRDGLREDVLLVVDSAYAEYMEEDDYDAGAALVEESDNVVMTRTFSKIYGLAGLRLGWAFCPAAVADVLNRIRGPFNVGAPAQAAALAALDDQDFVARNREHNRGERDRMAQQLGGLGLEFTPSFANFILVRIPEGRAAPVRRALEAGGVLVRDMAAYRLPDHLRISIGSTEANRRAIELLERNLHG